MMGGPAIALVVLIAAAVSDAAVVTQQQAAPGYYLAHPVQPYLQGLYPAQVPSSYLYTPVVPVPAGPANQQNPKQQQQGLATVKAMAGNEPYPDYYSDSNGRFLSTLLNPINSLNTLVAQLLNKEEQRVATASTLLISDSTIAGLTPTTTQGTAVFWQKTSTSNLNFAIFLQYSVTNAASGLVSATTLWTADIRTSGISTTATTARCGSQGALFPTSTGVLIPSGSTTGITILPAPIAGGTAGTQTLSIVGSVSSSLATLFGSNTINGHSVRIASTANTATETFCGNVVLQ